VSNGSDVSKRALSAQASATIAAGIVTHVKAAVSCIGQAKELLEEERKLRTLVEEGECDRAMPARLAAQRAVHELEAAVHSAALTSIGCTLATLEAQGFEVRRLCEVRWDAEAREKEKDESPS